MLDKLIKLRIIWSSSEHFDNDEVYKYYPEGKKTYKLFGYRYTIVSINQLMYHYCVIRYLNPNITMNTFEYVCKLIAINSLVSKDYIDDMIIDAYELDDVPKPDIKKYIFNPKYKLNASERMSIIKGHDANEITDEDIYEAIGSLQKSGIKVSASRIATYLDVSRTTLYKYMSDVLKKLIQELKSV